MDMDGHLEVTDTSPMEKESMVHIQWEDRWLPATL
jgi:hypothetical protein